MGTLKSCPFCNGEAIILKADQYHRFPDTYYISCRDCTAGIGPLDTEAKAIEAWNRRVDDHFRDVKKMVERTAKAEYSEPDGCYLCGECGYVIEIEDVYCAGCGARLDWSE